MGYHLYGLDMTRDDDPVSAGLGWVVPLDKGEFVGREAILEVWKNGPSHKLQPIELTEKGIPRHGMPILVGGEQVATVASGGWSPTLQKGIATAYLPAELAVEGTELTIQVRKRTIGAVVVTAPFVKSTSLSKRK
jgi:aminomethyltransferase